MNSNSHDPFHISVLLNECLSHFADLKISTFFDGTLGAGGHATAILSAHEEIQTYIGCDQDPVALKIAGKNLEKFSSKMLYVQENFSSINEIIKKHDIPSVDGILLDLGMSSMQIDSDERGFSFRYNAPLDMRMDPKTHLTAEDLVNECSEKDLGAIFRDFGEEKFWRKAAAAIVDHRKRRRIQTTKELVEVLQTVIRSSKKERIHPATRVFQALRIAVNDELCALEKGLEKAIEALSPGGRIGVISFHSLEDRIVKHAFQKFSHRRFSHSVEKEKRCLDILTKKPLIPTDEERKSNPRARSAKLRFAEKRIEE